MLRRTRKTASARPPYSSIFAALGDDTRLAIVSELSHGERKSIAELTAGTRLTRQGVTKHLRVLSKARIVHSAKSGRENLFHLDPQPIKEVRQYADVVSEHWDNALARLKELVES